MFIFWERGQRKRGAYRTYAPKLLCLPRRLSGVALSSRGERLGIGFDLGRSAHFQPEINRDEGHISP